MAEFGYICINRRLSTQNPTDCVSSAMKTLFLIISICCLWITAQTTLFAVDLGTDFLKVALIKPGRVPISVVVNEISKRKSRANVAVVEGDRYLADEAYSLSSRHPQSVFHRMRDFLGKQADDEDTKKLIQRGSHALYPLDMFADEERGTVRFRLPDNQNVTAEELVGSLLFYAKRITAEQAGIEVLDCVIAVPAFFGPIQQQALLDAASTTGLNVLALVNSHSSAALQYGIERDFAEKAEDIIIYDMGSNSIQVALVSYSSYPAKEKGKPKTVSQFEVKDATWNENLGGDSLDWILVDYFAEEFLKKHSHDLKDSPRAMAKLKVAVRKTKEILSANVHAPLYIEGIYKDVDFSSSISRDDFERLAEDFFEQAKKPLEELIQRNNVDIPNLAAIEMIGGGTRVPKLKDVLSSVLGGRQLDRHLDADEAVVMGAGLVAANLSTTFRLRQFGLIDAAYYPISIKVEDPTTLLDDKDEVDPNFKSKALLPYLKQVPRNRVINLSNFSVDPFLVSMSFNSSSPNGLPAGAAGDLYAQYNISGVSAAIEKHGDGGKVSLAFKCDMAGMVTLEKAEYMSELLVLPEEAKMDSNSTSNSTNSSDDGKSTNSTEEERASESSLGDSENPVESTETQEEDVPQALQEENVDEAEQDAKSSETKESKTSKKKKKPKKKIVRTPLEIDGPAYAHIALSKKALSESTKVLSNFLKRDKEKLAIEKAKNDLESYIYAMQEKLSSSEEVEKVTTEEQRAAFSSELSSIEDWLYMDGENEPAKEFKKQLSKLKKTGDAIELRVSESEERPKTIATAKAYIEIIRKSVNTWPEVKPYLNQTAVDALTQQTDEVEKWLDEIVEKQEGTALHEPPVVLSTEIMTKIMAVDKPFKRLSNKRAPKPPAPEPSSNTTEGAKTLEDDQKEDVLEPEESPKNETVGSEELDSDYLRPHDEL